MLRVRVPAKVNFHLQLLGRRSDGYHEIRTLLQSIDLYDDLEAEEAAEGVLRLAVDPPGSVASGDDNLVIRAARELWRLSGRRHGADLRLSKRIPVGGGLGGGSADAAATLVVLDRLWSLGLGARDLQEAAASIGSDVPFFLHGGLALGVGRGDEVYPLPDLAEHGVVVVSVGEQISTGDVYGRIRPLLTWNRWDANVYAFAAGIEGLPRWQTMVNDLQPVVVEGWPEVAEVVDRLHATGPLRAAVTGSGSAAFAVYPDRRSAERARAGLGERWWCHAGVTLDRARARMVVEVGEGRR